jgi:hypothetical protein
MAKFSFSQTMLSLSKHPKLLDFPASSGIFYGVEFGYFVYPVAKGEDYDVTSELEACDDWGSFGVGTDDRRDSSPGLLRLRLGLWMRHALLQWLPVLR